ncbi:MAG: hypothetical protein O2955_02495 [Planctomycetota bacterium]|nr:hypothetical protein [Planctomycetota bacterium]MDA1211354.1 hypothetical protein [Planctomycetota bacterium]
MRVIAPTTNRRRDQLTGDNTRLVRVDKPEGIRSGVISQADICPEASGKTVTQNSLEGGLKVAKKAAKKKAAAKKAAPKKKAAKKKK